MQRLHNQIGFQDLDVVNYFHAREWASGTKSSASYSQHTVLSSTATVRK